MSTSIEWTDETWNPAVGCTHLSPGCDHCYAAGVASRQMQPAHEGLTIGRRWNDTVRLLPDRLSEPLHWRKPRKVFVGSMTDLFHRDVPESFIGSVYDTMGRASAHTYQVLTKRPQRMADIIGSWAADNWSWRRHDAMWCGPIPGPLPNVWLGTSIESDRYTWRADHLRATPAAVRFLSLEPLLGPLPSLDLPGIDWVIVGGESGPAARPMHPDWVRDIRDRCLAAGVPFLFKQWGAWKSDCNQPTHRVAYSGEWYANSPTCLMSNEELIRNVGKHAAGRRLDGRTWDEFPAGGGS